MTTSLDNKAQILADLWLNYRQDEQFTDFVEYNDLGLPLAYAYSNDLAQPNEQGIAFINEAFELLLAGLNISEDTGFDNLDELFDLSDQQ